MANEWNIIGDVHGNYAALMDLVKKMPDTGFMSVGDMIDRGPQSYQVMKFFMRPGNMAIMGNHEHMMIEALNPSNAIYEVGTWFDRDNGGLKTVMSMQLPLFDMLMMDIAKDPSKADMILEDLAQLFHKSRSHIDSQLLEWLLRLPMAYRSESGDLLVTHAAHIPITLQLDDWERLWITRHPIRQNYFQVHGHVRVNCPSWHVDHQGVYGINIDTGRGRMLTGIHWPSRDVYSVEY